MHHASYPIVLALTLAAGPALAEGPGLGAFGSRSPGLGAPGQPSPGLGAGARAPLTPSAPAAPRPAYAPVAPFAPMGKIGKIAEPEPARPFKPFEGRSTYQGPATTGGQSAPKPKGYISPY